ncbi:MAG: ABC transporter substrate-binding protein [Tepidisphaeraceae bacterium]|jgi:ABC-type transport system substrate-binding protein
MRKTKWIFFFYLGVVGLFVVGVGFSLSFTPARDPYTLYTEHPGTIRTLDPAEAADQPAALIIGEFYECLYNYKYGVNPYELFPELAAEMPVYSDGGTVMTIRLRKGIRFYDPEKKVFPDGVGPEITARDVIYSFKRVCDANLSGVNYSTVFEDRIVGIEDWWNYTKTAPDARLDWDRPVKGFQILDDHTIRLVMPKPNPQMIYNLAASWTSIVSRDAVNYWKRDFRLHPVGTGAYYLKENLPDQRIVLEANPIYRGKPDVDGGAEVAESERLPRIKRMEYDYFTETLPPWILFTQGLFDAAIIPKESFGQAIQLQTGRLSDDLREKGVILSKSPLPVTEYIGFNMEDPIVGPNRPLRQAMSMAFDRESYIENFWNGRGFPAIGPIPPGFVTYDPSQVNPYTQFNLAAARKAMKEAEKINGGPIPPLRILMRDSETLSRQMAENFALQMSQIGLSVQPEYRDFARWNEMVDNRQTQLFDAGWVADYPDEQDFLQMFYGKNAPAMGVNSSAYVNPAFDQLYDRAAILPDGPERRRLYVQMEEVVMNDCPWLIEFYPTSYALHYDWLGGLHSMDYGYGYRQYVSLDYALRRKRLEGR